LRLTSSEGPTLERKRIEKFNWYENVGKPDLLRRKARLDPERVCTVPGCSTLVDKENLGSLCEKHKWRQREAGHAWHPMPFGKQRRAARLAVVKYLESMCENDADVFIVFMRGAINRLREPLSNAIRPGRARAESPTLTTQGKAQIVFAWLNKRKDFDSVASRFLIEAMSLELWAACFYQGERSKLNKLLHTTVGRTAITLSKIRETIPRIVTKNIKRSCYPASEGPWQKITTEEPITDRWEPSKYVRTFVGKRIFNALRELVSPFWITDEMILETVNGFTDEEISSRARDLILIKESEGFSNNQIEQQEPIGSLKD